MAATKPFCEDFALLSLAGILPVPFGYHSRDLDSIFCVSKLTCLYHGN
jgi:hypothetical protein